MELCPHCNISIPEAQKDVKTARENQKILAKNVLETAILEQVETQKETLKQKQTKDRETVKRARETGDWSKVPPQVIKELSTDIIVTSSFYVANKEIEREIEFIASECVYGMNIFRDFFAGVRDIVGGRSAATQNVLRDAERYA